MGSNKHHKWLAGQIPAWVSEGLLRQEQAAALLARYPVSESISLGRLLISAAGAIMIGLGIILLFAYNWAEMPKAAKLATIFSAFIGAHLVGLLSSERNTLLSEGFHVLGTMLMGSSIFLVAQIYHLDSHYPNAFLLWSVGALALAWAKPSLTQAFMTLILVLTWHLMEVFDFHFANHWAFTLLLIGVFPLVFRLGSPLLARFTSAGMLFTLGLSTLELDNELSVTILLLSSALLLFINNLVQKGTDQLQQSVAREMAKPAAVVFIVILYLFTFGDVVRELLLIKLGDTVATIYFALFLILSQLAFGLLALRRQLTLFSGVVELAVLLALLPMVLPYLVDSISLRSLGWLAILYNLMLLAFSLVLMIGGATRGDRWRMVFGAVIFTALAMARYTDLFESLIARALVFVIVGVALFVLAHVYQRHKREAAA